MLPFTLQFLIAMIASAINERLQRKLDYSREEVRVLKEILCAATGKERISFTADQSRRLALLGIKLSPEPSTVQGKFRKRALSERNTTPGTYATALPLSL
jgi:hypothetical protein